MYIATAVMSVNDHERVINASGRRKRHLRHWVKMMVSRGYTVTIKRKVPGGAEWVKTLRPRAI